MTQCETFEAPMQIIKRSKNATLFSFYEFSRNAVSISFPGPGARRQLTPATQAQQAKLNSVSRAAHTIGSVQQDTPIKAYYYGRQTLVRNECFTFEGATRATRAACCVLWPCASYVVPL